MKFEVLSMIETTDIYCFAYGCPKNNRDNDCPLLEIGIPSTYPVL
jgi:hypothetical protein